MGEDRQPIPEFYTQGSRKIRGKRGMQNDKFAANYDRIFRKKETVETTGVKIIDNDVEVPSTPTAGFQEYSYPLK